jgi:hypothetical protein
MNPMKTIVSILTFITFLSNLNGQELILGTENSVVWGKESTSPISLKLDYKCKIQPINLLVGYDNPNGTKFRISFKDINVAVDLRYVISMKSGINEFGDCNEGYFVQVATYDFDNDKKPEIIIAVGDGLVDMSVNVIKYHEPTNKDDAIRTENWSVIAKFQGQDKIRIEEQKIIVPIGSQGLYDEYTWQNNKFVKTN